MQLRHIGQQVERALPLHLSGTELESATAFGALFGFVGMLVAVPAAAMIGVVGRFLLEQYKHGRLYRGAGGDAGE